MTILTGTRWTILTKLPVAFSGGKAVNFDPEPSWMLSTWPLQLELRIGVDLDLDLLARAACRSSWFSLKFAVIQTSGVTIENICWPGVT